MDAWSAAAASAASIDDRYASVGRSAACQCLAASPADPADAIGRCRPSLERRRDALVQVPPLARREVLDDRLGEQPVAEPVAGLVRDQHLAVDAWRTGVR